MFWRVSHILLVTLTSALSLRATAESILGDRLVVEVNKTPYSQRQVESYVMLRELLREKPSVLVVNANNWEILFRYFTEEMAIHQEALRLGSVQLPEEGVRKALGFVQGKLKDEPLRGYAARLGLDTSSLNRVLGAILRVDAFRTSREKQAALSNNDSKRQNWLRELFDRTIVRFYADAFRYAEIQPTSGVPIDAL
jgi:hypothetical protein